MKKITFFMALVAIAFSIRAQYSNSTFLLTEGQYGSSSGGLYWLNPETQTFGSCVSDEINSTGYGETPIFASFFGDELFVVSKQQGSYGGGVLTIADAYSFENIYWNYRNEYIAQGKSMDRLKQRDEVATNEFEKKQVEKWNENKGTNLFEIKLDFSQKTKNSYPSHMFGKLKMCPLS